MKKMNFDRKFFNHKGVEIGHETISDELSKVLFNAGAQGLSVESGQKFIAYKISTKLIAQRGIIELNDEEIEFLKKFCEVAFTAGAYGQIVELLN